MEIEKKRRILQIILGLCLCGIVISIVGIAVTSAGYTKSKREYANLKSYVTISEPTSDEVVPTETIPVEEEVEEEEYVSVINIDFDMDCAALKAKNPDFVGWIYYDPLNISYPVVVDKGNDYYENHSFEGEYNPAGAIFMDYLCKTDLTSFNTIIYGHNMRNDTLFGALNELIDHPDIIEEHPYFYIFNENEALMYEIVAAYYTQKTSQTYDLNLDYTLDDMKDYVNYIDGVALYKNEDFFNSEVTEDTKFCTMSTCHGFHSTSRTVIHGALVAREPRQ